MTQYRHDTITPFENSTSGKKEQVAAMFDRIAHRYDFLNRFLSARIDLQWRKKMIGELKEIHPKTILDVATGTGDVAILMAEELRPEKVTGIDISTGMLQIGREKVKKRGLGDIVNLEPGDSEAIHFPDASFQAVTAAFGVRNFENLEKGLTEMLRVMQPGGKLVILEFSRPKKGFFYFFYSIYLRLVAPQIGKMFSKDKDAYTYLNKSVIAFPEGPDFCSILDKCGFQKTSFRPLTMGVCSIYCGFRSL